MKNNTNNEQINTRQLVMEMLLTVTKPVESGQSEYSHIVIREVLNKYNYLSQQEKSFIKRLFEGTLERMIEIDYVINQYSKVKVNKMKPVIRTIMRMGVYQIIYMDAVPDSAACNESVKLAQKKGFATLKGFVNGVLRNIARNKENIEYPSLSVKYSMPEWIVEKWSKDLGVEITEKVLEGLLAEHPVTIRFRDLINFEAKAEKVKQAIEKQNGKMTSHKYLPYAYHISKTDDITKLPGYEEGTFVIQDVSSMLAIESLFDNMQTKDGFKVLDICAAPGGKSMLAADVLNREGVACYEILSRDLSEYKVSIMDENYRRCGLDNIHAQVWDATELDETIVGKMDVVIADVPCSGLGVIGKKRDIKYKVTHETTVQIVELQRDILKNAVKYLKPHGRLLFSTCTINSGENEENFEWIKNELGMKPLSLNNVLPKDIESETAENGYIQLLPGIHDTDGFFVSVFEKI